jgi:hypothetical protein
MLLLLPLCGSLVHSLLAEVVKLRRSRWQPWGAEGVAQPPLWTPVPRIRVVLLVGPPLSGKTTLGRRLEQMAPSRYAYFSSGEFWRKFASTRDGADPDAILSKFVERSLVDQWCNLGNKTVLLDCYKRGAADLEIVAKKFDWLLDVQQAVILDISASSLLAQCKESVSFSIATRVEWPVTCRFFRRGFCKNGARCKKLHGNVPREVKAYVPNHVRAPRFNGEPQPEDRIAAFFKHRKQLLCALSESEIPLLSISVECSVEASATQLQRLLEVPLPLLGRACRTQKERRELEHQLQALLDLGGRPEFSMPGCVAFILGFGHHSRLYG